MDIYETLQDGVYYLIGITLVVGAFNIKKFWGTPSCLILLYLLILFTVETLGDMFDYNQWLYNISGVLELSTLTAMFYWAVRNKIKKKSIVYLFGICILFLLYEALFTGKGITHFWTNGYGLIGLAVSVMSVIYMLELATTEKVLHLKRILLYWIVIGLLIYQLVNLPVTVLINSLEEIGNANNILIIQSVAGFTMYLCFIIGFIWTQKTYNS